MPTEILRPNGLAEYGIPSGSGGLSNVNDDSDSTSHLYSAGSAFGGISNVGLILDFPTPTGNPDSTQTFYARSDKSANGSVTGNFRLYENGSNVSYLGSHDVFQNSIGTKSATWSAASLGAADGSLAQCAYYFSNVPRFGQGRIYDVWWDCNYVAGASPIEGTLTVAEAGDSLSAAGDVAVAGEAGVTEGDDSLDAAGTVTNPAIDGTAAITEADDSLDASGGVAIAGTASLTEADDTADAAGAVAVDGTADITEAGDSLTAAGDVSVSGTATVTEDGDTLSAEAAAAIAGTASVTEDDDALTGAGAVAIAGSAALTEADDTLSASSGSSTSGGLDVTEADDTIAAAGSVAIDGAASIGEAGDTLAGSAAVAVTGSAGIDEADDSLTSEGSLGAAPVAGTAAITEGDDALDASGAVAVSGSLTVTESGDTLSAGGTAPLAVTDPLEAIENALSALSGVTVYRNRVRPIPAEDLPAINIRWLRESVNRFDKLDFIDRDASIAIVIRTDGDAADDQVDAWCEDIEVALYGDATLSGLLTEDIQLESTGMEWDDTADRVYLTATMIWSARYVTTEQAPSTPQ